LDRNRFCAVNRTRDTVLVEHGDVAASAWARLRGLLRHAPLQPGEGLLLRGEKAIHTIGMGFAIDVVFLDRAGRVVHLIPVMAPLRLSPFVANAADVLELPPGTIARTGTMLGDQIELEFT
jgi:uncharacterized membrane protein (UPF0127 family)